jgi:RNA polymerase sigma factor (sigma-70 family)
MRRYDAGLRGYCIQLLRRIEDAEDALQDAMASAHRALLADGPPREPRAWLFAIARNRCLSILRNRPPEPAPLDDIPTASVDEMAQSRAEVRAMIDDLGRLDGDAREALVLTRLGDLSHRQVAEILGCEPERVRTLVRQARVELAAARLARNTTCEEIRAELVELRRGGFRRAHIRRHLAGCEPCRTFRRNLAAQDRDLGLLLPLPAAGAVPALGAAAAETATAVATKGGLALAGSKAASSFAVGAVLVAGAGVAITVQSAEQPSTAAGGGGPTATAPRPASTAPTGHRPVTDSRTAPSGTDRGSGARRRSPSGNQGAGAVQPDDRPPAAEPAPTSPAAPPQRGPSSPAADAPPATEPPAAQQPPEATPDPSPAPPEPTPDPSPKPEEEAASYVPQPPMPPAPAPTDDGSGQDAAPPSGDDGSGTATKPPPSGDGPGGGTMPPTQPPPPKSGGG